jgi:excisionase family DNA binding protein
VITVATRKKPLDLDAEILTIHDVAAYLRCSVSTLYRLAKDGSLPAFKVGTDYRFNRPDIEEWMRQRVAVSRTAVYPPRVKK